MANIKKQLSIEVSVEEAFNKFLKELNQWWPKEYTWSQEVLEEIRIDPQVNGLCTEIGPFGFRCDWGRITELVPHKRIGLKWQISPKREPIPNPKNASDIRVSFAANGNSAVVEFEHYNFENHGIGAEEYRQMMDSAQGWDYILQLYKTYCEK